MWRQALLTGLVAASGCAAQVHYLPLDGEPFDTRQPEASLYLVGDAGMATPARDAVLAHLRNDIETIATHGTPVVVAFLGDNLYEDGARQDFASIDLPLLEAQAEVLGPRGNVQGVFVPGNHDWGKGVGEPAARTALRLQTEWLNGLAVARRVSVLPEDGCPGPAGLDVGPIVRLVFIDTEWLLREPDDRCAGADAFYDALESDLAANDDRRIVVLAHHPLATGGPHGGNVSLFERGPFVFYLATKAGVSRQDLASGAYSAMIERLNGAFGASGNPPLAFAAGHDHNLQVIRGGAANGPVYHLVSGAGAKSDLVSAIAGTRYATPENGYMRLDFFHEDTRLRVYSRTADDGPMRAVFACTLSQGEPGVCPEAPRLKGSR